jgi:hypothetical protein
METTDTTVEAMAWKDRETTVTKEAALGLKGKDLEALAVAEVLALGEFSQS